MLDLALRACVQESSPRAVLVLGPPGIGKSRLRYELLRQLSGQNDGMALLVGLGDPIRTGDSGGLLGSAVARLCGIRSDAPEDQNRAALEARIGRHLSPDGAGPPEQQHLRRRTTVFMGELCGLRYPDDVLSELRAARQNPNIMADLGHPGLAGVRPRRGRLRPGAAGSGRSAVE